MSPINLENPTNRVLESLYKLGEPSTRGDLANHLESEGIEPEQISRALHYLKKSALIIKVGERPSKNKFNRQPVAEYVPAQSREEWLRSRGIEAEPTEAKDLDAQLAEAIRKRDQDDVETVIAEAPVNGLRFIEQKQNLRLESDDPVIREIAAYREPRIQDGQRLAKHLLAGAAVIQDRLPGLATSMREAADALREFSA
jgi:hypothetical protein